MSGEVDRMKTYTYIVLSNPVEGREDEYNDWYTNTHIVDVMKVPGLLSAQRFRLAPSQRRDPPHAYRYLTIYEIDGSDLAGSLAVLKSQSGTAAMPVSDAFDPRHIGLVFEAITPKLDPA